MVHIRGHITEREYEFLVNSLNNEIMERDLAKGILNKITTNKDERGAEDGRLGNITIQNGRR